MTSTPSPTPDSRAPWTPVWELCPSRCPDWDHWKIPPIIPKPPAAASPLLTRSSPPPLCLSQLPAPSLARVKPMRVEVSPSTCAPSTPSLDPMAPAAPETSIKFLLGPRCPGSVTLLFPLRTSTTSPPRSAASVTGREPGPLQGPPAVLRRVSQRTEDRPQRGSTGPSSSLLPGLCSQRPRDPQVILQPGGEFWSSETRPTQK